jgi:release factor glutamine methyltransferase
VRRGSRLLAAAGVPRPRQETEILLAHLLGRSRVAILAHPEQPLGDATCARLETLCRRRAAGEPAAYLTGVKEFWSLELTVDSSVLVPRPETEHLVEEALRRLVGSTPTVADFGTGSGCVALALAHERPDARILGIDCALPAAGLARFNARRLGLERRFHPVVARSLAALGPAGCLDGIVSNPPYIPLNSLPRLSREVREHEPMAALSPGPDGLEVTRALVPEAARLLGSGGFLALEIDPSACRQVKEMLAGEAWTDLRVVPDLAGRPRVVSAARR